MANNHQRQRKNQSPRSIPRNLPPNRNHRHRKDNHRDNTQEADQHREPKALEDPGNLIPKRRLFHFLCCRSPSANNSQSNEPINAQHSHIVREQMSQQRSRNAHTQSTKEEKASTHISLIHSQPQKKTERTRTEPTSHSPKTTRKDSSAQDDTPEL